MSSFCRLSICVFCESFISSRAMSYYAVRCGRIPGIYRTWNECKEQVEKFQGAKYKKFPTLELAKEFIDAVDQPSTSKPKAQKKKTAEEQVKRSASDNELKSEQKPKKVAVEDTDGDGEHVVYTDGACFFNGENNPQAGIGVYWGAKDPRNVSERLIGKQTNNRAEIHAACRAILQAKSLGYKELTLKTDSAIVLKGATEWMKKWKKNEWKTSSNKDVENKEDFQYLDKVLSGIEVQWKHVAGHSGILGNEEADRLAGEGAKILLPEEEERKAQVEKAEMDEGDDDDDSHGPVIYVDGCCHYNGKANPCAALGIYWGKDDKRNKFERVPGEQQNYRADIYAASRAIEQARKLGFTKITIKTDNNTLVKSASQWMAKWKKNDWLTSSKEPVKNKDDLQALDQAIGDMEIKWVYVKSGCGSEGHTGATALSKQGTKLPLPTPDDAAAE